MLCTCRLFQRDTDGGGLNAELTHIAACNIIQGQGIDQLGVYREVKYGLSYRRSQSVLERIDYPPDVLIIFGADYFIVQIPDSHPTHFIQVVHVLFGKERHSWLKAIPAGDSGKVSIDGQKGCHGDSPGCQQSEENGREKSHEDG